MKQAWQLLCKMTVGEVIALTISLGGMIFIIWSTTGTILYSITSTIHPPLGSQSTEILDLTAQRGMNLAAWAMAIITAISLVVGTVTLVLLRANLKEARVVSREAARSALAAEHAAQAAREGNEINRQVGQAQVRAHMAITGSNVQFFGASSQPLTEGGSAYVSYSQLNAGQTPAKRVYCECRTFVGPAHEECLQVDQVGETISDLTPGSERSLGYTSYILVDSICDLFAQGIDTVAVYVEIEIFYDDVFGEPHTESTTYFGFAAPLSHSLEMHRQLEN